MGAQASLDLLGAIAENTSDLIWAVDVQRFALLAFNRSLADNLRRALGREVAVGLAPQELLPDAPEQLTHWTGLYERALREGDFSTEYTWASRHWLLNFGLVRRNDVPFAISVFGRDITDFKRIEHQLKSSQERFKALIEQAPLAFGIGRAGVSLYGNRKYLELLGLSGLDELVGKPLTELWAPESAQVVAERNRRRSLGQPVPDEYMATALRKDGTRVPLRVNVSVVELADGPATLAIFNDETARCQAEAALRDSETFYRTILETGQDVHVLLDAQARIKFVSRSVTRVLGWTEEEILSIGRFTTVHPDDRERVRQIFARVAAGDEDVVSTTFRMHHKNGSWRTVLASTHNCLAAPEIGGVLLMLRDITDEVRREEELRQAQKMESVGQLAGGVAHDFNNLLTVILGNVEEAQAEAHLNPRLHEALLDIQKAGKRAATLTRQLLTFSRRQMLAPQVFDLNAAVLDMKRMLARVLKENVAIEFTPTAAPLLIEADRGQLDQVLLNLALNASDAMANGGTLQLELGVDEATDRVVLKVSDNGTGIAPEVLPRIFEPFFTTKEVGKGTGLGLATVYGIIRQSRGSITVRSELGRGTTFTIVVPRAKGSQAATQEDATGSAHQQGQGVILLAEDDDALRKLVRRALESRGFRVLEAADGGEARSIFDGCGGRVDILISDYVMPHLGGRPLVERLRARKPDLKVLLMSGHVDADGDAWALQSRIDFLPKPFSTAELVDKVRRILSAPP